MQKLALLWGIWVDTIWAPQNIRQIRVKEQGSFRQTSECKSAGMLLSRKNTSIGVASQWSTLR